MNKFLIIFGFVVATVWSDFVVVPTDRCDVVYQDTFMSDFFLMFWKCDLIFVGTLILCRYVGVDLKSLNNVNEPSTCFLRYDTQEDPLSVYSPHYMTF